MKRLVTEGTGTLRVEEAVEVALPDEPVAISGPQKLRAYVALTKPRIIQLLLVTTVPAMVVAERGWPSTSLVLYTVIGGMLAAAGANAINCYIDRDIDQVMHRTKKRPLPMHKIPPENALLFGSLLAGVSFLFLALTVNVLAATLALAALFFYVFVYTIGLKRSTPQNIVIGGAAGAVPVLVGWAAVTDSIELPALALFAIVFYWTPPHFWALAMRYEKEYAAAGVPMMPVVYGKQETSKHILLYSFILLAMCLAFFSLAKMGLVFLSTLIVLNALFIGGAVKLWRQPTPRTAWGLFRFSIYYLALLFGAAAVDQLLPL